jgi:hypothetical protein
MWTGIQLLWAVYRIVSAFGPHPSKNRLFASHVTDVLWHFGLIPKNLLLAPKMESSAGCESFV